MKRYITEQPHRMSCGSIAIMNALKWLGYSAPYRETMKDLEKAGYEPKKSKWACDMKAILKAYGIKFKFHENVTVNKMKKIVNKGNALIFAYDWVTTTRHGTHYIFIDFYTDFAGGHFNAYNYHTGFETGMLSENYIDQCIYISKKIRKDLIRKKQVAHFFEIIKE